MAQALEHAWHDGRLQSLADVRISPLDRGYLFGDGVYEVIPVYGGRPLALDRHLARLNRSCAAIRLPLAYGDDDVAALVQQVVDANGGGNQSVYLQISRTGDAGRDHRFPEAQVSSGLDIANTLDTCASGNR